MAEVKINGLTKYFGNVCAVNSLSLDFRSGSIFGIVGSNGAGKSTTLRILCGLERPTSGTASVGGLDCWNQRALIKLQLGYVPQNFDLYPDLTVEEHLYFFAGAFRLKSEYKAQRVPQLLEKVDLVAKRSAYARGLSGGQKRLLSLACALAHEPKILFLDEPTAGLDAAHRDALWDWLYELSTEGITIGVTTHYLEEAERCVELAVMNQGCLLAKGTPVNLKATSNLRPFEVHAEPVVSALNEIKKDPGVIRATLSNGVVRVLALQPETLFRRLDTAWPHMKIRKRSINWDEPTLDDVCSALVLRARPATQEAS